MTSGSDVNMPKRGTRSTIKRRQPWGKHKPENSDSDTPGGGEGVRGVKTLVQGVLIFCSVKLRDDDGRSGGESGKEADDQIDDLSGRSAHAGKRLFTDKMADDDRVYRVIKLLKKCTKYEKPVYVDRFWKKPERTGKICDIQYQIITASSSARQGSARIRAARDGRSR